MGEIIFVEIKVWWLLIVPLLLIISLFVIALIMKNSSNERIILANKEKTLTSWITHKDILYWLLIISLGAISIFTYQYKGDGDVISHWGFAGTIVSIILAVVAIGFTLFQTLSSNLSSEKIAESAEKIERATNNLDTETLLESSEIMNNAAYFLKERITLIEESLLSLDTEQKRFNEIAATGFSSNNKNGVADNQDGYNIKKFIDEVYPKLPFYSQVFTYTFLRLNLIGIFIDDDIKIELREVISDYDKNVKGYNEQYTNGAIYASEGATFSFVISLGIIYQFYHSTPSEKEYYLKKCQEPLNKQMEYLTLMDNFILEKETIH